MFADNGMEKKNMPSSEAQKRASIKYQKANYKNITLKFRHDEIERLRAIASSKNMSPTAYVYEALMEKLRRESESEAKEQG